ncbi:protein of unknown function, might belong to Acyl-CoA synthetase [Moritella yayanosii]|uniref:Uncharacterized protein n=1 Tax=Moritella yayanosii TaxID=69539 RepID=A0A330LMM8_9GAMM|nr:protein of unknown function, might belong to Acyl-CoA synthetase [Moritella yayanosii]
MLKRAPKCSFTFACDRFHSGDLAVWHEGSYVEIKDRSKDVIISGGETFCSFV